MFKVLPSLLAFNKTNPYDELKIFQNNNFDFIHYDVMDHIYVNNLAYDFQHLEWMSKNKIDFNVHLMVIDPINWVNKYFNFNPKGISYHFETVDYQTNLELINSIKKHKIKAGIAIHPYQKLENFQHLLKYVDYITFMSVVPGKGGQPFLIDAKQRLIEIYEFKIKNKLNFLIEIDGGIDANKINELNNYVDLFVSGSSLIKEINNLTEFKKKVNME